MLTTIATTTICLLNFWADELWFECFSPKYLILAYEKFKNYYFKMWWILLPWNNNGNDALFVSGFVLGGIQCFGIHRQHLPCSHVPMSSLSSLVLCSCPYLFPCCCCWLLSCLTLCDLRDRGHQAPLSSTICWSLLKFIPTEPLMLFNHLILCCPLILLHLSQH